MTFETPSTEPMSKDQIYAFLQKAGWSPDKKGNLTKQGTKRLFRVLFKDESVRIEVQVVRNAPPMRPDSAEWVRMGGAFIRNVVLHEDGQMQIGTEFFKVE